LLAEGENAGRKASRQGLERIVVVFRDYLRVSLTNRPDIQEGEEPRILVQDDGILFLARDPAKEAVAHACLG
jgi:hypothetical protein